MPTPHHPSTSRFRPILALTVATLLPALLTPAFAGEGMAVCQDGPFNRGQSTTVRASIYANAKLRETVRALDRIRDKVEEWGVVTISAPVAVMDYAAFYVPSELATPEEILQAARTEVGGVSAISVETGVNNQFGAVAVPGFIPPPAEAISAPAGSTVDKTTTKQTTVSSPHIMVRDEKGELREEFKNPENVKIVEATPESVWLNPKWDPFALLKDKPTPVKSMAASLQEASQNILRQKITSQMSFPKPIDGYSQVIFAIVQVSCNPGWRTQEHYTADVSCNVEYCRASDHQYLSRGEELAPTIFSVLPLLDAQTIDMSNSQRQVTQLAFNLAASLPVHGVAVKAKDVFQFVKRFAKDSRTVTAIPVVNSYSNGNTFGFRFSPSFLAQKDPALREAKPANVLLPTSFPALITLVVHNQDLLRAQDKLNTDCLAMLEHTSTRWQLKDRPPLWQVGKRLFQPMKRDSAEIEVGAATDVATVYAAKHEFSDATGGTGPGVFNAAYQEVRREIQALESKGVGRDWPIPLPPLRPDGSFYFRPGHKLPSNSQAEMARKADEGMEKKWQDEHRTRQLQKIEDAKKLLDAAAAAIKASQASNLLRPGMVPGRAADEADPEALALFPGEDQPLTPPGKRPAIATKAVQPPAEEALPSNENEAPSPAAPPALPTPAVSVQPVKQDAPRAHAPTFAPARVALFDAPAVSSAGEKVAE